MSDTIERVPTPRQAVYLLARTQNDWHTLRGTTGQLQSGFAEGVDDHGRQLRWISCPDCLANDRITYGCETCNGRGEIPDPVPDPMRNRADGPQAFYGHDHQEQRDRARAIDAQIVRLRMTAAQRDGLEDPEDWLTRTVRLKRAHDRTGDYLLLETAQQHLGWADPGSSFVWQRCVIDGLPHAAGLEHRLDRTADQLAGWMLAAIAVHRWGQQIAATRLGIRRPTLRPEMIVVPVGLAVQQQAGRGRWANQHSQGQRNALVVAMHHEGKTAGEISRRVGLTKRRVQQLLSEIRVEAATGPAA